MWATSTHRYLYRAQNGRADDEDEDSEELQQALLVLMAKLEALAVSSAAGELMPALAPALAQSLADVSGADAAPEDSAAVWECLSDLLCSPDAHAAQVKQHPRPLQMCLLVALKRVPQSYAVVYRVFSRAEVPCGGRSFAEGTSPEVILTFQEAPSLARRSCEPAQEGPITQIYEVFLCSLVYGN